MIELNINGIDHKLDIPEEMPLLWAIRDIVKLTGSKYGCGKGLCGACTVHINGEATRSCVLPVSAAVGQKIKTIEGLSDDASHPLQKAWMDLNVPQCGYCQSGQIMSAASLLDKNSNPSNEDIDRAMSGNICRCGTYPRIRSAIHQAAKLAKELK